MSKAILVMDMPKNCRGCPCSYFTEGAWSDFCQVNNTPIIDEYKRVNCCPLREVPQKKDMEEMRKRTLLADIYYAQGYNACIDEILGGGE